MSSSAAVISGIFPKGSSRYVPVERKQEDQVSGGFFKRESSAGSPGLRDLEYEKRKTEEYVKGLMKSLTPREQNLIKLRFWEDKTDKEISNTLGVPEEKITPMLDDIFSRLYCIGQGEGE